MSKPTTMTYAAAQAILRAPRFADPEAIRARDLVARVELAVELKASMKPCEWCDGDGSSPRVRDCPDESCSHCQSQRTCEDCQGMGVDGESDDVYEIEELWATLPPDARQEALRRARTNRAKVKA